ncbi:MAG: hypothetical protein KAT58_01665 [candidate division Zixibacteria bacterium]|nr:hypothetical protein [candidate division Zixibacteria bacterium]
MLSSIKSKLQNRWPLLVGRLATKSKSGRTERPSYPARLKSFTIDAGGNHPYQFQTQRARLELYRFLRDNVPILSSVVWTWVRLCAARYEYKLEREHSGAVDRQVAEVLRELDSRIYHNGVMKRGGFKELLLQFFESLFTDGAICGELQLMPSRSRIDRFMFADMKTIEVTPEKSENHVYQVTDDSKTRLNNQSLFYYGLGALPGTVIGKSLLAAVPFVARVEQTLVSDMHRTMRNSGYQRIHVKVTPPAKRGDETEDDYVSRANSYFDDTVTMMKDFGPDKNPVTWDDVKIEYIGPSARVSTSNAWYLTHKAMIEDICAGTHLAPFMLGYAYGTTHNWAQFKFELVQRQVETVQNAACALLDWIANVELALAGLDARVRYSFRNRLPMGLTDRAAAEKIQLENIVTKLNNNLITRDQALDELERI